MAIIVMFNNDQIWLPGGSVYMTQDDLARYGLIRLLRKLGLKARLVTM